MVARLLLAHELSLLLHQHHQTICTGFTSKEMDCTIYCLVLGRIRNV